MQRVLRVGLVVVAVMEPAHAEERPKHADDLPVSVAPPREASVARPWLVRAPIPHPRVQVLLRGSPVGWTFDDAGDRYAGGVAFGAGLQSLGHERILLAYATYELSRLTRATFSLHAFAASARNGFGGTASAGLDLDGRWRGSIGPCFLTICIELDVRDREGGLAITPSLTLTFAVRRLLGELTYARRTE